MPTLYFCILFLIQPFLAAVSYLVNLRKKCPNKIDCIIWSLIISLLGIYWFPWGDNQTHFAIYYTDIVEKYYTFDWFSSYYVYDYVIAKIAYFTGNYVWGYFFWLFTSLSLFYTTTWSKYNSKIRYSFTPILFILLLMTVGVRELLDLNRNTTAILFSISAFNLITKSKILPVSLLLLSYLIHSSVAIIIIIAFCLRIVFRIKSKRKFTFLVILVIALIPISNIVLRLWAPERVISMYLDGQWGEGTGVQSGFAYIISMVNNAMFVINGFYIIRNMNVVKRDWIFYLYVSSFILCLFVWFLWTLRERFIIFNLVLGVVLIISNWESISKDFIVVTKYQRCVRLLIICCVLRFSLILMQTYSSNFVHHTGAINPERSFAITLNSYILPTPLLLYIDEFGYNDTEYLKNFNRVRETVKKES